MFSTKLNVRFSECNRDSRLKVSSLVDHFQDCCNLQSIYDGINLNELADMGIVWILNSWNIVIDKLPSAYDEVTVYTWPYDFKGFYGLRNFKMEDSDGNVCAYADSLWTLVDIKNGRPYRITEDIRNKYHIEPAYPMEYEGRKIPVDAEGEFVGTIEIKPHHIDVNNHMNNAQYVLEASDYIPEGFIVGKIRVEYKKQTLCHEKLELYRIISPEYVIMIMKDLDGVDHAVVKFDKRTD